MTDEAKVRLIEEAAYKAGYKDGQTNSLGEFYRGALGRVQALLEQGSVKEALEEIKIALVEL